MAKAIKKTVEIEFITFEDFVEYGKQNSTNIAENGMPWSFDYKGCPVSHENDDKYIILTFEGTLHFERGNVLLEGDYLSTVTNEDFKENYQEIPEYIGLLKSDSVYQALRYAWKNPSSSGVDDCDDYDYQDLYHIVCELRK